MIASSPESRDSYEAGLQKMLSSGRLVETALNELNGSGSSDPEVPPVIPVGEVPAVVAKDDRRPSLARNPLLWKLTLCALILGGGVIGFQVITNPFLAHFTLSQLPKTSQTSDDLDRLQGAVAEARAFLAAKTAHDRLPHFRHPRVVEKAMIQWEARQLPWRLRVEDLTFGQPIHMASEGNDYYLINARESSSEVSLPVYPENAVKVFEVDWQRHF